MTNAYRTDRLAWVIQDNVVNVNVDPTVPLTVVNLSNEVNVLSGVETTILTYTVPAGKKMLVKRFGGTGHIESEFYLKVDGTVSGYLWTSAAEPNATEDFADTPVIANAGSVVTVSTEQYELATYAIRGKLQGELIDG